MLVSGISRLTCGIEMEYINSLRKFVGHKPLLMIGAAMLILDEQNRVSMIRRSESGNWGLPGGAMELGETTEETARRELLEETNLQAGEMELFGVFSGPQTVLSLSKCG